MTDDYIVEDMAHSLTEPTASGRFVRQRVAFRYQTYSWYSMLTHPWLLFTEAWDGIRDFCERGWYGYSATDLWCMDRYIASWLPDALRNRASHGWSVPNGLSTEEWRGILLEIAEKWETGHTEDIDPADWDAYVAECARRRALFAEGMTLFAKWYWDLWD
ncbi:MAG: hypothetical protein WC455_23265 [Dehalococcoidia bacterium]